MNVEVYFKAVEKIDTLQRELRRLEEFVSTFRELAGDDCADISQRLRVRLQTRSRQHTATRLSEMERTVVELIIEHGAPIRRAELFRLALKRGVTLAGAKPLINFSSKLSRMTSLINLPKLGYWPKERPFDPAGYRPDLRERPLAN